MDTLQIEDPAAGIRLLRLNRPQARNALTTALQQAIDDALTEAATDEAVRAVVITGEGDQAFSAGYDLKELAGFDEERVVGNYLRRQSLLMGLARFPKPLIAAVNGLAHGGGAILATLCDLRVGSANSEFRFTAAAYNGVNNTWQLPLLVGPAKALEFVMTARIVGAREALACGLLNSIAEDRPVVEIALDIAAQIAMHPPAGVQWHKALIRDRGGRTLEQAFDAENAVMNGPLQPGRPARTFDAFLASRSR